MQVIFESYAQVQYLKGFSNITSSANPESLIDKLLHNYSFINMTQKVINVAM